MLISNHLKKIHFCKTNNFKLKFRYQSHQLHKFQKLNKIKVENHQVMDDGWIILKIYLLKHFFINKNYFYSIKITFLDPFNPKKILDFGSFRRRNLHQTKPKKIIRQSFHYLFSNNQLTILVKFFKMLISNTPKHQNPRKFFLIYILKYFHHP